MFPLLFQKREPFGVCIQRQLSQAALARFFMNFSQPLTISDGSFDKFGDLKFDHVGATLGGQLIDSSVSYFQSAGVLSGAT